MLGTLLIDIRYIQGHTKTGASMLFYTFKPFKSIFNSLIRYCLYYDIVFTVFESMNYHLMMPCESLERPNPHQ